MFNRILSLLQMRQSTAFLLARGDDRLLDDIGLTRDDLKAMHLGMDTDTRWLISFPSARTQRGLPVTC